MPLHRETWPDLLRLGWPVSATLMVRVSMRTVDLVAVGIVVGASGIAALGIGDAAARILLMTALGLSAGSIATISQRLGAGRTDAADVAVTQTAMLAIAIGVPFTILGLLGARPFFEILGAAPEVVELGVPYLQIIIATAVPRALAIMLTRALQGAGDTRTPMVIRTIGTGVNIALTVLLVGGLLGLPKLGVRGAAIATATGNLVSAGLLLGVLAKGREGLRLRRHGVWAPDTAREIVRIGTPQVIGRTTQALGNIPLNAIVLTFGTAANAGFQVGRRAMLYGLLPSLGIATAASAYMGNRVGGRDPDAGERYGRGGLSLTVLISMLVAIPLAIFARPVASLFLREAGALGEAATWVRVFAAATVLRAAFSALRGASQGAGDTRSPLMASLFGILVFSLGFSWLTGIVLGLGALGVYLGVVLDPAARTAVLYRWFDRGRWRSTTSVQSALREKVP